MIAKYGKRNFRPNLSLENEIMYLSSRGGDESSYPKRLCFPVMGMEPFCLPVKRLETEARFYGERR